MKLKIVLFIVLLLVFIVGCNSDSPVVGHAFQVPDCFEDDVCNSCLKSCDGDTDCNRGCVDTLIDASFG